MLLELLRKRRSVRQFTEQVVEQEKVEQLLEMALRSPSSRGLKPWQFVVVQDPAKLEQLSKIKSHGGAFVKDAPLAIVVLADPEKCDVWVEDAAIASAVLHFGAESLGLGSCWVQVRKRTDDKGEDAEKNAARILNIPENMRILSCIALGYAASEKQGHDAESLDSSVVHWEQFKN